jgi:hypothetical protein
LQTSGSTRRKRCCRPRCRGRRRVERGAAGCCVRACLTHGASGVAMHIHWRRVLPLLGRQVAAVGACWPDGSQWVLAGLLPRVLTLLLAARRCCWWAVRHLRWCACRAGA